jgi:sulfate/thiosulfate transport system substrate-binding protein
LCLALLVPVLVITGCGKGSAHSTSKVALLPGAYTTPREAYGKPIIPAFHSTGKNKTGQDVDFQESYRASGAQSRDLTHCLDADRDFQMEGR